jgi:RNA polymerase sigma factor (sigma-70 family)
VTATLPPFQGLLDAHRVDVHRFCVVLVGANEADDCFQETFLAALRAYPALRSTTNLKSWLMTIAHRKAIDAHRARGRRASPSDALPEVGVVDAHALDDDLWLAVAALPPKQREAVRLRYADDREYEEIGAAIGCSAEAARRNVFEGLKALREGWIA